VPQKALLDWVDEVLRETSTTPEDVAMAFPDGYIATWGIIQDFAERLDIGSHTQSHIILGRCIDRAFAEKQVSDAKSTIESRLNKPCRHFAYPNGNVGDHTDETREMIARCGHETAFLTEPGIVTKDTDPLRIPRFYVGETSAAELAAKILGFERWWEKQVGRLRSRRPIVEGKETNRD
jgi:peptidoglycan/xylan/chitin deacetylase (PgdA/CDA1 family)